MFYLVVDLVIRDRYGAYADLSFGKFEKSKINRGGNNVWNCNTVSAA